MTLGLSKVTRQAAQRWRNPVEDGVLASRIAKLHGKDTTESLTLALSRKGRGDGYRGRLRFANRPYLTRFDLTNCPKRRIRVEAWAKPRRLTGAPPSRGQPSHLAAGAGDRRVSVKDAAAPDCRRHLAPLTIHEYSGPTEANDHLTEPASAGPSKSMKLVMQPSELNGFSPLPQSSNRWLTQVRGVMEGEPRADLVAG